MSADLTKRVVVRVTDDQLDWIGRMAADEGMDNATFVRVVLDRLSKGRAPLIGMMTAAPLSVAAENQRQYEFLRADPLLVPVAASETDDILAQRAAEAEASLPETVETEPYEESAAIPLRRVARTVYNPGRR
jgi:hypothetical protein